MTAEDLARLARIRADNLLWCAERPDAKGWDTSFLLNIIDNERKTDAGNLLVYDGRSCACGIGILYLQKKPAKPASELLPKMRNFPLESVVRKGLGILVWWACFPFLIIGFFFLAVTRFLEDSK